MSAALPFQNACCTPCEDTEISQVPGPQGTAGTNGTDGDDGKNACTLTTATFSMPVELGSVNVEVGDTSWVALNQILYVEGAGYMQAVAIPDSTNLTLKNLEETASSMYASNVIPGTNVAHPAKVTPGGMQGPNGNVAAGVLLAANNLADLNSALAARSNLGLGTMATQNGNSVVISGGAISGINDLAVADGGTGASNATNARANLGLVIGTNVQAQDAGLQSLSALPTVADRYPYSTAADTWAEGTITAAGRAILDDATAAAQRGTLGLTVATGDYLLYRHQLASTSSAGDFTSGSWQTVPLNTEVADTGGHGSIAGNTVTLAQGVYRARWRVCGFQVDSFQSRIFNVTNASVVGLGSNAESAAADGVTAYSHGEARITIAAATEQIRLEAQCQTTNAGDGFGVANSFGGTEVYASLELEKEAG